MLLLNNAIAALARGDNGTLGLAKLDQLQVRQEG